MKRKYFIDNLRCAIVVTVIVYHLFYELNSVGVIRNVAIAGIPQLDLVLYVTYPWFMVAMFLLAGISARYSIAQRGNRGFLKERVRRVLVPSIAGVFFYGWITGYVTSRYVNMFPDGAEKVPVMVRYLIYGLSGIGPLWFLHVLFVASVLLVLLRRLDPQDKLGQLGRRINWQVLVLLVLPAWGSSFLLVTPFISVYRFGIYLFYFFLGYEVFAWEEAQNLLARYHQQLLMVAIPLGALYTLRTFGQNYADPDSLTRPLVNAFAWFATVGLMGSFRSRHDHETAFSRYMRPRSFGFFVLHMPLLVAILYGLDQGAHVSGAALYLLAAVILAVTLPLVYEGVHRIPGVRRLLLGE